MADATQTWTYADLGNAIGRFITVFRSIGLVKGGGLAMLSGNRVECIAAQIAAVLMGVRYTTLHPKAGVEDHVLIIEDAEIDTLLVEAHSFGERGTVIRAQRIAVTADSGCRR